MKVRVRYDRILKEDKNSVTFMVSNAKVMLPKDSFKYGSRNSIILDRLLATQKNLRWKLLFHIPPYIKPVYNQECIDELKFRSMQGD